MNFDYSFGIDDDEYGPRDDWDNPLNWMSAEERAADEHAQWVDNANYKREQFLWDYSDAQDLNHFVIADAWAFSFEDNEDEDEDEDEDYLKPTLTFDEYKKLERQYAQKIKEAVFSGKLNAIIDWSSWVDDRWTRFTVPTSEEIIKRIQVDKKIAEIRQNTDFFIHIYIDRNDFFDWASKTAEEIPQTCLLGLWKDDPKDQAVLETIDTKNEINDKRRRILKKWYSNLILLKDGEQEAKDHIKKTPNKDLLKELREFDPIQASELWANGEGSRAIGKYGKDIWGFNKAPGRKKSKM